MLSTCDRCKRRDFCDSCALQDDCYWIKAIPPEGGAEAVLRVVPMQAL